MWLYMILFALANNNNKIYFNITDLTLSYYM